MILSAKVAAIEFDGDVVRVAVVRTGARLPVVLELQACRAEYEEPEGRFEALVKALDTALGSVKARVVAYVLCVNCQYSFVRTITIPFRGRRRVAAAVPFELEPHLAFPIEELLVGFNIVAEIDGETEVLATGMRRAQLEEQLAVLEEAGVEIEAVSLDAVCLTSLWQAGRRGLKGLKAVLHVRASGSSLAIVHNKALAYFRHITCTAEDVTGNPAAAAREVQNSIRAFLAKWRGEGAVTELHVTGIDFTAEDHATFSEALQLPVHDEVLISRLKGGALALEEGPTGAKFNTWEAAIGAGLGSAGGAYSLDFSQAQRDWQGAVRAIVTHLMFSSCLGLLVLLGWAFYYYQGTDRNMQEAALLQERIDELTVEIEAMSKEGLGDINTDAFADPTLLDVLGEIGEKMPESKVAITEVKLAAPGARSGWLTIRGSTQDAVLFNEVFDSLKTSRLFRIDEEREIRSEGDTIEFTVKAFRMGEETDESS